MTPQEYYRLTEPTELAGPPAFHSPTSLASLRKCPLRWQFEKSRWGDLARHPGTPNRKRIEGSIIHNVLDAMFRQLGRHGRPPHRTEPFRDAMRALDVNSVLAHLLKKSKQDWDLHPRTKGYPLGLDPGDLRKRAFHLFRKTYQAAGDGEKSSCVSGPLGAEVDIRDGELRLRGRVDHASTAELREFKTGAPSEEHQHQLELYALMWSRQRGILPRLTLVYPGESKSWKPSAERLTEVQLRLQKEISELDHQLEAKATAQPGEHCRYCSVRAFCDSYWERPREGDVEFVVTESPGPFAIGDGSTLVGLHAAHVACSGPVEIGDRVRLLGVQFEENEAVLPAWGELFVQAGVGSGEYLIRSASIK